MSESGSMQIWYRKGQTNSCVNIPAPISIPTSDILIYLNIWGMFRIVEKFILTPVERNTILNNKTVIIRNRVYESNLKCPFEEILMIGIKWFTLSWLLKRVKKIFMKRTDKTIVRIFVFTIEPPTKYY
jgi:hypothetical protein|tara:strand:- start:251 stop:634 length:384 start_codon:yes stop_codon:yes gene_type:complete